MKLLSIVTPPSPNCMKLNFDQQVSAKSLTLQADGTTADAPDVARQLLAVEGVSSVFLTSNFIALTRKNHADWQSILSKATQLLGATGDSGSATVIPGLSDNSNPANNAKALNSSGDRQNFGQVEVAIQEFRGIPIQVRVTSSNQQVRVSLPERFNQAAQQAVLVTQANYVAERRWAPYEPRFGDLDEVAQMVADELVSLIDQVELARRVAVACGEATSSKGNTGPSNRVSQTSGLAELKHPDWEQRLKALQQLHVTVENFSAVVAALQDERNAIRRYAAAVLGSSEMPEAVEPLCQVFLSDKSPIVRRTVGDALSDLGNTGAIGAMCQALEDRSPLVRWRAARYLNEVGNRTALVALHQASQRKEEFEVQMELTAAIARIESDGAAPVPVWMQISRSQSFS